MNLRLKGVFENQEGYAEVLKNLKKRFNVDGLHEIKVFEEYGRDSGYSIDTHYGKLKDGVELTELELAMICDRGYAFFGGSSTINADGKFAVQIYTD